MNNLKIAVVSDIHGNADALKKVLETIRLLSVDITVFLGDLLTYGCQPQEVLDLLRTYSSKYRCVFIKGNHDQFYFDLDSGKSPFGYSVPSFVSESVAWTKSELQGEKLQELFYWKESFHINSIYFSHANPYLYGNWTYVESVNACIDAAKSLSEKGFAVGVFGHSHRKLAVKVLKEKALLESVQDKVFLDENTSFILNPGSTGQPRGHGLSFMVLHLNKAELEFKFHNVEINLKHYATLINKTKMSLSTKERLISYLGVEH